MIRILMLFILLALTACNESSDEFLETGEIKIRMVCDPYTGVAYLKQYVGNGYYVYTAYYGPDRIPSKCSDFTGYRQQGTFNAPIAPNSPTGQTPYTGQPFATQTPVNGLQ